MNAPTPRPDFLSVAREVLSQDQELSSSRGRTERPSGEASAPSPFARARVRQALAAYRAVRFSIKTGVRAYFTEKEAAREAVFAAVSAARADRVSV